MSINRRIGELKRERRRRLRDVLRTTSGSVTVGSPMMNRRERVGGPVQLLTTYEIVDGEAVSTTFNTFGSSTFDVTNFGP
jgi:hypothetical protein